MSDDFERWAKAHYLDASALVKLVIDSPEEKDGRESLRRYVYSNSSFYTTSLCFAEALGVIKVKYWNKKKISMEQYLYAFCRLYNFTINEVPIGASYPEMERIVRLYNIDVADAMQIVTLKNGMFSALGQGSKTILITADKALAEAADKEGLRVWNCKKEPWPK